MVTDAKSADVAASTDDRAIVPIKVTPPAATLPSRGEMSVMGLVARSIVKGTGLVVPAALNSPAKVFAVILAGWELGVKPMTALRHIFVVNGRTEPDAQLMMGLAIAKDPSVRFEFIERTRERCAVRLHRSGQMIIESEYTLDDAKASGQFPGKDASPWRKFTSDMLTWSAVKRACRVGAPDLINSISTSVADSEPMLAGAIDEVAPDEDVIEGTVTEITSPELYNDGDERETETPAAPFPEEPGDAYGRVGTFLTKAKRWDVSDRNAMLRQLDQQFPNILTKPHGELKLPDGDGPDMADVASWINEFYGDGPAESEAG